MTHTSLRQFLHAGGGPYAVPAGADATHGIRYLTPGAGPVSLRLMMADPAIDPPAIALEFAQCLDLFDDPDTRGRIRGILKQAAGEALAKLASKQARLFPSPAFDSICFKAHERGGVWLRDSGAGAVTRQAALAVTSFLTGNQYFGFLFSAQSIQAVVDDVWAQQNKVIGKVHLQSFSVKLEKPNRIITRVNGYRAIDNLPDVDFSYQFTETLSIDNNGFLQVDSSGSLDADLDALEAANWLLLPVPAATIVQDYINEKLDSVVLPSLRGPGTVLTMTLRSVRQFLVGEKEKIVFVFDDVSVDPAAGVLVTGGSNPPHRQPREPRITLFGAMQMSNGGPGLNDRFHYTIGPGPSNDTRTYAASYYAAPTDLRPPYSATWTGAAGNAPVDSSDFPSASAKWVVKHGSSGGGKITVTVTDADGAVVTSTLSVIILYQPDHFPHIP